MRQRAFNYNNRIWGTGTESTSFKSWGSLKLRFLFKNMPSHSKKILEIGCGGGKFSRAVNLKFPKSEVYGVDLSSLSLRYARSQKSNIIYKRMNGEKLAFKEATFDCVYLIDVLEHVENPQRVLNEVSRVLKPKGVCVSMTPIEGSRLLLYSILRKIVRDDLKERQLGHINHFTKNGLITLHENSGLILSNTQYSFHILSQIFDILLSLVRTKASAGNSFTFESYVGEKKGLWGRILGALYSCIVVITNLESYVLGRFILGQTLFVVSQKEQ